MSFRGDRLRSLREAKAFSQERLAANAGISQSVIAKAEKGTTLPTGDVLDKLASALDCTMDYLYGRGADYISASAAAIQMSFDVFSRNEVLTELQRERCRRALKHPNAPKTAKDWLSLAEMIEMAVRSGTSATSRLAVVKRKPARSKPLPMSRIGQP